MTDGGDIREKLKKIHFDHSEIISQSSYTNVVDAKMHIQIHLLNFLTINTSYISTLPTCMHACIKVYSTSNKIIILSSTHTSVNLLEVSSCLESPQLPLAVHSAHIHTLLTHIVVRDLGCRGRAPDIPTPSKDNLFPIGCHAQRRLVTIFAECSFYYRTS